MMFKKGDRVLCVDARESEYLVIGQWYIVNSVFELSREQKIQLIKDLALSL